MTSMDDLHEPIDAEIQRIAELPAAERAAALEALEARMRASLDEISPA